MLLFIIFLVITIAIFVYGVTLTSYRLKKKSKLKFDDKKLVQVLGFTGLGFAVSFTILMFAIAFWKEYTLTIGEKISIIFGGFFASSLLYVSLHTFLIYYYCKDFSEKVKKIFFKVLMVAFPLSLVFVFILTNGFANHVIYPLIHGINFKDFTFTRPDSYTRPTVAFYALCIISGALYTYFYCDHKFYKIYGEHGILESTFYVGFPMGIVGARLFYVIGNWEIEFKGRPFIDTFKIWDGGITIIGGAFLGILCGVLWFLFKKKKYSIWHLTDIVIPSILLAQAVGRWGNFFNCEVHGEAVSEIYWKWLPKFIFNQAHYSSTGPSLVGTGTLYAPFFLVESFTNLLGFFVMAHLFGIRFKKYLENGDIACMYPMWYGLTRVIMEPLRYGSYKMGSSGYWSWFWSLCFFFGGLFAIAVNHLIRFLIRKSKGKLVLDDKTNKFNMWGIIITIIVSTPFIVIGAFKMANNTFVAECSWNAFNAGLTFLVAGLGLLSMLLCFIPYLVEGRKITKNVTEVK